ncbi:MAG: TonB-dependent receptor [Verrucomicrobia bacterium]|nr:TonB-dependent receptor [Verrucomicrobiota bacterium]
MKPPTLPPCLALAVLLQVSPGASGQAVPVSGTPSAVRTSSEIVELSPFAVQADRDTGYRATSTLSGTRINTSLRDIAASIQAITPEFLEDAGITNDTELLQYTTSTEVAGGAGGNFFGGDSTESTAFVGSDENRRAESSPTRIRGMTSASRSRNLVPSLIPFDSYNTARIEINRGANSVLVGLGSPAGIIDHSPSEAGWRNEHKVAFRTDNFGSIRTSLDFNRVVLKDRLAVRVAALNDQTKYKQDPAFRDDRRYYGAATYRPFRSTTIVASFEKGWIDSTLPRQDPPRDYLTHFSTTGAYTVPNNTDYRDLPATASLIQFDSGTGGRLMALSGPTASTAATAYYQWPDSVFNRGIVNPAAANPARANDFRFRQYALQNGREYIAAAYGDPRGLDAYQLFLIDPTVFDFFNNNIDGRASYQWGRLQAFNAALRQELFGGRAGIELGFDQQRYDSGFVDALDGIRGNALKIDVNQGVFAYASPGNPSAGLARNPDYLRPFIGSRGSFQDRGNESRTFRATGLLRHNFAEHAKGWMGRLLGRHSLTLLVFDYEVDRRTLSGNPSFLDYDDLRLLGVSDAQSRASANSLGNVIYLGDSLAGRSTVTGLGLTGYKGTLVYPDRVNLNVIQSPTGDLRTGSVRLHHVQNDPLERLATGISVARDRLETQAAVLQSHWWDGALVTTYGLRRDEVKRYSLGSASFATRTDFTRVFNPGALDGAAPANEGERDTLTYSGVLRLNRLLGRRLPRGVEIDLHYGWSENYQGLTGVRSVKGGFFDAPVGETTERGFSMGLFEGKLLFRANWFETAQRNLADSSVDESITTITSFIPDFASGGVYNLYTAAQLAAVGFTMPPSIIDSLGIRIGAPNAQGFSSYTRSFAGQDIKASVSRGFEWEATYNVTRNWRFAVNVAETKAVESEKGTNWAEVVEWVQKNWFSNPAIRALRVGAGGVLDTVGGWEQRAITGFRNIQATNGASNPRIVKWRGNAITNYTFPSTSRLRGVGVGGGVRFQDRVFLGYQGKLNPADPTGALIADPTKPMMGPTETNFDFWTSYRRRIFAEKVSLKLQLNIRNAFVNDKLIPIRAQQADVYSKYPAFDHYKAAGYQLFRIAAPRTIQLTATFGF